MGARGLLLQSQNAAAATSVARRDRASSDQCEVDDTCRPDLCVEVNNSLVIDENSLGIHCPDGMDF